MANTPSSARISNTVSNGARESSSWVNLRISTAGHALRDVPVTKSDTVSRGGPLAAHKSLDVNTHRSYGSGDTVIPESVWSGETVLPAAVNPLSEVVQRARTASLSIGMRNDKRRGATAHRAEDSNGQPAAADDSAMPETMNSVARLPDDYSGNEARLTSSGLPLPEAENESDKTSRVRDNAVQDLKERVAEQEASTRRRFNEFERRLKILEALGKGNEKSDDGRPSSDGRAKSTIPNRSDTNLQDPTDEGRRSGEGGLALDGSPQKRRRLDCGTLNRTNDGKDAERSIPSTPASPVRETPEENSTEYDSRVQRKIIDMFPARKTFRCRRSQQPSFVADMTKNGTLHMLTRKEGSITIPYELCRNLNCQVPSAGKGIAEVHKSVDLSNVDDAVWAVVSGPKQKCHGVFLARSHAEKVLSEVKFSSPERRGALRKVFVKNHDDPESCSSS